MLAHTATSDTSPLSALAPSAGVAAAMSVRSSSNGALARSSTCAHLPPSPISKALSFGRALIPVRSYALSLAVLFALRSALDEHS